MTSESARRILERIERAWRPFNQAVQLLGPSGLERLPPTGWTAKEMLAHLAFWEEAGYASITFIFRQAEPPAGWQFGSGYVPDEPWPRADEHNAREAAWARARPVEEVLDRWSRAHKQLLAAVATVTDEEAEAHASYWDELDGRYLHHLPELEALLLGYHPEARVRREGQA